MDRDQQRQNRRTTVSGFSCTAGAELNPLENPVGRTGAVCDPTPAAPAPFTTVTPQPCPTPLPPALNLPDGLIVASDATIAYCPSTAGYSVTGTTASPVATGAQNQTVLFTVLENITENQLNYLYQVVPSSSAAIIASALSGATSSVIALTHLNYTQAEELITFIQDAKFTVNTLAVEQARNLLICQVENNLQVASCPTSAYFGPSAGVPTGMMYVPSATSSTGAVLVTFALSSTSGNQAAFAALNIPSLTAAAAQANLLALAQAESSLRCVFGNAATAAACCTSQAPGNNLGYTAACVPATGPTIPGSATAIGYFSVPENTVFSAVSKNEANSVARELSRNSLNCYFPSEGITATCVGLGLTAPFAPESTTSVYLPPGTVILYDTFSSVTAANAQALTIAQASLNCFWSNASQTAFCPPSGTFTAINNIIYNLDASVEASINYSSSVEANTVISYISQAAANNEAFQLAFSNLSCSYCNDPVAPTCSGGVNATVGAEANLICNVSGEVAQNTAISIANILVSNSEGGLNCCYGSDAVENTIFCGEGALRDSSSSFTSVDEFYLPADLITICASSSAPPPPPLYYSYSNLFSTDVAQYGCCSDIQLCGGITGSATALPTLWAAQNDLFNSGVTATFYTDSSGSSVYAFPPGTSYVVRRPVSGARTYRSVTGPTGSTVNINTCLNCSGLSSYTLRGASASAYPSLSAAYTDIFCEGPTAQTINIFTDAFTPFNSSQGAPPAYWYSDSCGNTAFNPVTYQGATGYYYAGFLSGNTGYMIVFEQVGSNASVYSGVYNTSSCPLSKYSYSVKLSSLPCATGGGATTLWGPAINPTLFTSSSSTANFYTKQLDDSSIYSYPSGTGYINFTHNTTDYSRKILGVTASPPFVCSSLYPVTVQWSTTSAADVCNYPNFYDPNNDGLFNDNIRSLWCDIQNPFSSTAAATFYTVNFAGNAGNSAFIFNPGSTTYLSEFTPGDTFRSSFRQYTAANPTSTLQSYTGTFKQSPFSSLPLCLFSSTADILTPGLEFRNGLNTKIILNGSVSDPCVSDPIYSDLKISVPLGPSSVTASFKSLPIKPVNDDIYSNSLLFDGVGFLLSATASGTASQNIIVCTDMTKIGAGFTGAIVRCPQVNLVGNGQIAGQGTAIPTYISSIDKASGIITLGGYYNKVNTTFSNTPLYVTGFKVDAGNWTGSQFTCYGDHCNKLDVGHSLFSYYVSPTGATTYSVGYVTRRDGNTIYYTGAPSYNNFSSFDIGTGASHGSGHVYVQGRQFARFWEDDNKAQPLYFDLQDNPYNYIWSQVSPTGQAQVRRTVAKNLVLGNTAGSTAEFLIAGVSYSNYSSVLTPPRPFEVTTYNVEYDEDLNQYYYLSDLYNCDGSVSIDYNPIVTVYSLGVVDSCCSLIAPLDWPTGDTAVSACDYRKIYGNWPIDPVSFTSTIDYLPDQYIDQCFNSTSHTPLTGTHFVGGLRTGAFFESATDHLSSFSSFYFVDGRVEGQYPCDAQFSNYYAPFTHGLSCLSTSGGGSTSCPWMREYIGYYNPYDPYAPIPQDCSTSGPNGETCLALDNIEYWSENRFVLGDGYVFKEYYPDYDGSVSSTACNTSNFIVRDLGLTSGYRYSIWGSTSDAWSNVSQLGQISGNSPLINFDPSTAGCDDAGPAAYFIQPQEQQNIESIFNFEDAPSVGGTAEDLKAQATEIAQNLVNSFVRCYYINDPQVGEPCPPPDITVSIGSVGPGEVVSQISKENANSLAEDIAQSRTICLSDSVYNGGGCNNTTISAASSNTGSIANVEINFEKDGCSFTPTITVSSDFASVEFETFSMQICSSTGETRTINLVSLTGDYTGLGAVIPIKTENAGPPGP